MKTKVSRIKTSAIRLLLVPASIIAKQFGMSNMLQLGSGLTKAKVHELGANLLRSGSIREAYFGENQCMKNCGMAS